MGVFGKILGKDGTEKEVDILDVLLNKKDGKDVIYAMAEARAINLIAKTIAKTEILVYGKKDKKITSLRDLVYWRLNLQPNDFQTGTKFLYRLALKLLVDKEVLIIERKSVKDKVAKLYVAESFEMNDRIFSGKTFSNINICDEKNNQISLDRKYSSDEVIYISCNNTYLTGPCTNFKSAVSSLLKIAELKYKRNSVPKWRLKKPGGQPTLMDFETQKEITYEEYSKKITEGLLTDEEAIILLSEAFNLENLNKDYPDVKIDDYKSLVKEICDSVANLYNIPLDIFYGNKTEKSSGNDDFISYAVDFYYENIEDGLNIGLIGQKSFLDGEYVMFNRFCLFHKDILESASGIDKLISSTFSRNEINMFLKLPHIDEEWADNHNLTKNYANVKGGEE